MTAAPSIVLVDDDEGQLKALEAELGARLKDLGADIRTWVPRKGEDAMAKLQALIDPSTVLVITDWDLSTQGQTGFFGPTIVGWCQQRAISVGDFSRKTANALPSEPNFFELRVPTDETASAYVEQAFRGFHAIRSELAARPERFVQLRSPSAVLATILDRPDLEPQLALYSPQLGSSSSSLLQRILNAVPEEVEAGQGEKLELLAYIAGHVLLNAVLKYPGPILSREALCAYFAASDEAFPALSKLFDDARYRGPFADSGDFFWRDIIDDVVEGMSEDAEDEAATSGALNRQAAERALATPLPRHECGRCAGENGGFYCPFKRRPVCIRSDCSVSSSSWLPDGARVCRVEHDFYEEWAPLLGL